MEVQTEPKSMASASSLDETAVATPDSVASFTKDKDNRECVSNSSKDQGASVQPNDPSTAPSSTLTHPVSATHVNEAPSTQSNSSGHGQDSHDGTHGITSTDQHQSLNTSEAQGQSSEHTGVTSSEQPNSHSEHPPSSTQQPSPQPTSQTDGEEGVATSRTASRFSVNLSNVGLPNMASNLGLTQANSERAADMAQDLKKNVVNMWHAWFPTQTVSSSSSSSSSASTSPAAPAPGAVNSLRPLASGTQSLSHNHNQQQQRPAKAQRMSSYTIGSKTDAGTPGNQDLTSSSRGYSLDISARGSTSPIPTSNQSHTVSSDTTRVVHEANDPIAARSSTCAPPPMNLNSGPIYLMGKRYPPSPTQWTDFQRDFTEGLVWCTYRHSYAPIKPSNFTSDVGWGCMLRSGQGLLANALAIQFMGRGWNRPAPGDVEWESYVQILSWFLDDMNARSPFSVHRIALLGKQLGKNIGEWFGPSTTSQVTKALVHNFPESGLNVYVTTDGVVYKDEVEEAATMKNKKEFGQLLILVTIRLGIDKLNPIYNDAIKTTFEFPQSLGIAGGRPSSSYYFVGYQGDDLFYLDPHHSRCVVETKDLKDYTAEDFATYHCETIRKIDINSVDPSMLLAFYCRDRAEFDAFCERVKELNARPGMGSSIFAIGEKAPVYGDDEGQLLSVADEEDDDLELIL
ncbi:Cysteine protease atg4 [Mortierella alpina]|nr:Cysteine protease atg4 [Mortierella alpina]